MFCLPWGRPYGNHTKRCINEKTVQCLPNPRSMYLSIFNSFPVIRTASEKNRRFHIFVSPGDAPATITQYVPWMERQFNACQSSRIMYLSLFNSFRVIRCLSQCVSRYYYHIFVSPGDAPGAIALNVVCMEREFDAYKLSRWMCPSQSER